MGIRTHGYELLHNPDEQKSGFPFEDALNYKSSRSSKDHHPKNKTPHLIPPKQNATHHFPQGACSSPSLPLQGVAKLGEGKCPLGADKSNVRLRKFNQFSPFRQPTKILCKVAMSSLIRF